MRVPLSMLLGAVVSTGCYAQETPGHPPEARSNRIFGFLPVPIRTPLETPKRYKPISTSGKFKVATEHSFSAGAVFTSALLSGRSHWAASQPSFGQGMAGYGRYFATGYGTRVIGTYMTDAIYPSLLHQDPRYFRRGTGSAGSRIGYALGNIVRTRGDSGRWQLNYSEWAGNATTVAIAQAYYPDRRTAGDAVAWLGVRLAISAGMNVVKEFSPELSRKLFNRRPKEATAGR